MVVIPKPAVNRNRFQDDIDDISQTSEDDSTKEADNYGASSSRVAGPSRSTKGNGEGAGMPSTVDLESLVLTQLTATRREVGSLIEPVGSYLTALVQSSHVQMEWRPMTYSWMKLFNQSLVFALQVDCAFYDRNIGSDRGI